MAVDLINRKSGLNKETLLITGAVMMIVVIVSLQDYFATRWNDIYYDFYESMAYKLFWILFIPFYLLFRKLASPTSSKTIEGKRYRLVFWIGLPLIVGVIHLLLFAFLLYFISPLFNEEQWNLELLIKEKLTTRLYIVLTVYFLLGYFLYRQIRDSLKTPRYNGHLTVKNGNMTTLVKTNEIKWIKADNGYLILQTSDKRHVLIDSLKNILKNLDPDDFRRIHKSTIVNLKMIKSFKSRNNGDYDVNLLDGTSLRLSRNYVKPIKDLMF